MAGGLLQLVLVAVMTIGISATGDDRINFMSLQMEEADRLMNLPSLPDLVDQLGLSKLYSAIVSASLGDKLSEKGPFTLFAPTNQAFTYLPDWLRHALKNLKFLTQVLMYHVLAGEVFSHNITDELSVPTLMGQPIRFNIYPNNKVVTAQCAPIDVQNVDKNASNGVLHELKAVMLPAYGNIVETASHIDCFKTLVSLLKTAGLVDTLSGKKPFTVFAPTNSAFKKLDPKVVDYLMKNKTALIDVLTYHVVKLTYCSVGLVSYKNLTMLNGETVKISVDGKKLMVNNATVLALGADGSVTNGVVHAIDSVLIPPSLHPPLHPSASSPLLFRGYN